MSDNIEILSIGMAHELAERASITNNYKTMREICVKALENPDIVGDADDYHNFSVVISREDDYLYAYRIVEKGLEQFPYNTDLLADAIYYGSNCKKYEECDKYIDILMNRPYSSWTWRAFSFTIDYFKGCSDWKENAGTIKEGLEIALDISKKYQKYMPDEERAYLAEYDIRQLLAKVAIDSDDYDEAEGQKTAAIELMESTINTSKYSVVKCTLRYADEMFKQREYEKVIEICAKALQFGEASSSVRLGYFMYLSAQSREILLHQNKEYDDTDKVNQIYNEYVAALADTGDSYIRNIAKRVKILSALSGIEAPSELTDLV